MTKDDRPPHWWTLKCDRCGEVTNPPELTQDPDWGSVCGRCDPDDYQFDAGFDKRQYERVIDLRPVNPCGRCGVALPVIGICDCQ